MSEKEKEYYEKIIKALKETRKDLKKLNKKLGGKNENNRRINKHYKNI